MNRHDFTEFDSEIETALEQSPADRPADAQFVAGATCSSGLCGGGGGIPWCQVLWIVVIAVFLLAGCGQLEFSAGPLLYDVQVTPTLISPNADGDTDVTDIFYSLRRPATVSIYFDDAAGNRYYFRQARRRANGDYNVQWAA